MLFLPCFFHYVRVWMILCSFIVGEYRIYVLKVFPHFFIFSIDILHFDIWQDNFDDIQAQDALH